MAENSAENKGSFAVGIGAFVGLIARDVGGAAAVVAGLWAGILCVKKAAESPSPEWPLFLIGGGIFVALATVCRWRGRA
jgi:hypothetical protein